MTDLNHVLNAGSVFAFVFSIIAIAVAVYRRHKLPISRLLTKEQRLERRVEDLERQFNEQKTARERLEATVRTLQDLLTEKQAEILTLQRELAATQRELATLRPASARPRRQPILLAVIGNDPELIVDLAALRDVEREGGFRLSRLENATMADLKATLDRYRSTRRPIENVHISAHAGPAGVQLGDELVTAAWLSENLKGVQTLVIDGCQSSSIGDRIGIVPAVVTMREELSHDDAAQFARLFWSGIGRGQDAESAFDDAVRLAPQSVAEFAELHI